MTTERETFCTDCDFCGEMGICHDYDGSTRCSSCERLHNQGLNYDGSPVEKSVRAVAEQYGVDGDAAMRVIELAAEIAKKEGFELSYTTIGIAVRKAMLTLTKFYEEILAGKTEQALKVREEIFAAAMKEGV